MTPRSRWVTKDCTLASSAVDRKMLTGVGAPRRACHVLLREYAGDWLHVSACVAGARLARVAVTLEHWR